mgnify:CR=1 FL=1
MKTMKNRILTIALAGMVTFASCADLTVENLNSPDTERALSSASDLTTLAEGLVKTWYNAIHNYDGFKMPAAVLADASSCSWGNVGMREMGTEPRPAFDNAPNYGYRYLTATPFSSMYSINSSASDVIKAINIRKNYFRQLSCIDHLVLVPHGKRKKIGSGYWPVH